MKWQNQLWSLSAIVFLPMQVVAKGQVQHFLANEDEHKLVIDLGTDDGIYPGDILISYRNDDGNEIRTGKIKVEKATGNQAIALILEEGGELTRASFPEYQQIMAKDSLRRPVVKLTQRQNILQDIEINYFALFLDPKANPETFELSDEGKENLRIEFKKLGTKHYKNLLVKAFTDRKGSFEENQVESYQRALTVKQFLQEEFHLSKDQVIAIGLGESDLKNDSNVAGSHLDNRRIVLKVR